jgi:hypothetical protein
MLASRFTIAGASYENAGEITSESIELLIQNTPWQDWRHHIRH